MAFGYIKNKFLHQSMASKPEQSYSMEKILMAFFDKDIDKLRLLMTSLNPYDKAEILNSISNDDFIWAIKDVFDLVESEALIELNENKIRLISDEIDKNTLSNALLRLETDDISYFISLLEILKQQEILHLMPKDERKDVKLSLTYTKDQVGRFMDIDFLTFTKDARVSDVKISLGNQDLADDLSEDTRDVFILDESGSLIGTVSLFLVLVSDHDKSLLSILNPDFKTVHDVENKSEITYIFGKYNLTSLAVVGRDDKIIGVISSDVAREVLEDENNNNILRLSGISDSYDQVGVIRKSLSRFVWLFVNLVASICAAKVIGQFGVTLAKNPLLVLFLPVVASIGGNSGNQVSALMIRMIATKSINKLNKTGIFIREFLSSFFSSVLMIIMAFAIGYFISHSYLIASLFGISVGFNVLLSSIFGLIIPFIMRKMNFDPVLTSSIFVTALTDASGFFIFLYLISIFLK